MSELYKFDGHDLKVVEAIQTLLWKLMTAKVLPPAKLISDAKVLHVLWHLPRSTKGISVTINIGYRVQQQEGISGGSSLKSSRNGRNERCNSNSQGNRVIGNRRASHQHYPSR